MAKKFIINDNRLVLGNVTYHLELTKNLIEDKTVGGGYWFCDENNKIMYFYGSSHTFGPVTKRDFETANKPQSIKKYKLIFSTCRHLFDVILEEKRKTILQKII